MTRRPLSLIDKVLVADARERDREIAAAAKADKRERDREEARGRGVKDYKTRGPYKPRATR